MFDHENAIASWRQRLVATGSFARTDLDELESHLHDELEALAEVGITGEEAEAAVLRVGDADALADEYARGNPAEAWRAPLLWCVIGCLATVATRPILEQAGVAGTALGLELQLSPRKMTALICACALLPQAAFFACLFAWARRSTMESVPFAWAESSRLRIGLVVACAFVAIGGHMAHFPLLRFYYAHLDDAVYVSALRGQMRAENVLVYALPIVMSALALRHRKKMTPGGWLAVGCLAAVMLRELHSLLFNVTLRGAVFGHLESAQMQLVTWVAMVGSPVLVLVIALRLIGGLPTPRSLAQGRLFAPAIALAGFLAIAAERLEPRLPPLDARYGAPCAAALHDTFRAFLFMEIAITCAVPVALGVIVLRLRSGLRERSLRSLERLA